MSVRRSIAPESSLEAYRNPQFRQLPDHVAALFTDASEASFFNLAAWYDLMVQHAMEPGSRSVLYVGSGAGMRVALPCLELTLQGTRELRGFCNAYSCEHAIIRDPSADDCAAAVETLLREIGREQASVDTITLPGHSRSDRAFPAMLAGLRGAGFIARPVFDSGTWYEGVKDVSFADYLGRRPAELKNTWRRKSAALQKTGRLALRFFTAADDIERYIADYATVYQRSWKPSERFPHFIPALIREAAGLGALRFGILYLDETPAAAQFWIVWKGRAVIYKLAHDERLRNFSPGTVLTMRMIERALETERLEEINFGRGDDAYKRLWLSQRRERWGIAAANPRTARGLARGLRLLAARARDRLLGRGTHEDTVAASAVAQVT